MSQLTSNSHSGVTGKFEASKLILKSWQLPPKTMQAFKRRYRSPFVGETLSVIVHKVLLRKFRRFTGSNTV